MSSLPVCPALTTAAGERGAADAERDIRGFALKFYTEEGIWDLVGNNTPVFFMQLHQSRAGLRRGRASGAGSGISKA